MKKFFEEFKEFINQGNVMDLAVAVVIGTAFTAIVNSVVSDLIMPLISLVTGGIDFSDMKIPLGTGPDAAAFTYGNFINAVIQFLIIALVVFLLIKGINKLHNAGGAIAKKVNKRGEEVITKEPMCPFCLEEVNEGATRCPHCAAELPEPAKVTEEVVG